MSKELETKEAFCPNCQKPAIRSGNEIACERCDAIFVITKKEGAKVKQLGPIEDHEKRISWLESIIPEPEPEPKPEPKPESEPEETSILG